MTPTTELIEDLRRMQKQIIHGKTFFGEIADRLESYSKALAIISFTEACPPPEIINGQVVETRGFSDKGHEDCVRLAQKVLRGESAE